jgi:ATP adenylyltransferase
LESERSRLRAISPIGEAQALPAVWLREAEPRSADYGPWLVDVEAYHRRAQQGPCFVCEIVAGSLPHHVVYEDETAIAFLNRFPTLLGYTIVAPKEHREAVTGDFGEDEYAAFQRVVHRVSEAVRREVPTERLYLLSLGSKQGNAHVHWHVAPLPPGIPYDEQQLAALDWGPSAERILDVSEDDQAALAERIRRAV